MAIYKNIDGTSKESFKIGVRGVTLKTEFIEANESNGNKLRQLLVDDQVVVTEDSMFIPRDLVSKFEINKQKNECTFEYKYFRNGEWKSETVTLRTSDAPIQGGVTGPTKSTIDGLVLFADSEGQNIKDSGYKILANILNPDNISDSNAIPTFGVVKEYVGQVENPLKTRITGSNAQILQ